jgi:hypothetical protein
MFGRPKAAEAALFDAGLGMEERHSNSLVPMRSSESRQPAKGGMAKSWRGGWPWLSVSIRKQKHSRARRVLVGGIVAIGTR